LTDAGDATTPMSVGHSEVGSADMIARSQLVAQTFDGDAPRFHDVAILSNLQRLVGVLSREQDGDAFRRNPTYHLENLLHQDGRQTKGGLIQNEKQRLCHETASDGAHLLFPSGQSSAGLLRSLFQLGKQFIDSVEVLVCFRSERGRECAHEKIFLDRHAGPQLASFRHQTEMVTHSQVSWLRGHVLPVKNDSPLSDRNETRQRLESGCLAGAVRSDDANNLAATHPKTDAPNYLDGSVGQLEIRHLKQSIQVLAVRHLGTCRSADVGLNHGGIVLHGLG